MDKRDRSKLFRDRLAAAMQAAGISKSALARATGADRSTVSLTLSSDDGRLPNAQFAAECASALGVSADWLLGLTDRRERSADMLQAAMRIEEAARAPSDELIFRWHQEARGYKIRHVPATLPDMLKSESVLRFEYGDFVGRTSDQAIADMRDRLGYLQAPDTDYEIAMPIDALESFAAGEGYWRGLPAAERQAQLDRLQKLTEELYPSLRLYLFDRKKLFSSPLTVFGPLQATVYVGRFHLIFRERRQVMELTRHFDGLVREADFEAKHTPRFIEGLRVQS
ncbi:helix-turn-helix domain-containing protein [Aurantimonas sp. VKM B-3413]|uniref:helix-turn-helix domain-containing protein n=1 Tax=Aurantimonas sp. VKM B-3413 TaxID=2779401 RepID=UPI001E29C2E4|nr:helix-turn-helix transcriptional regulator [Aurantimonas sp. VKM B-3413]MCB8838005.1 helix-turn-helix transcriptional regulator [Aurantimonas sp. VKM B-3413]